MSTPTPISLLVEDQQAGGMWPPNDKGTGVILAIKYSTAASFPEVPEYQPKEDKPGPGFSMPKVVTVQLAKIQADDDPGRDRWDLWSVGDASRLVASPNGQFLVKAPGAPDTVKGVGTSSEKGRFDSHLQISALGGDKDRMRALSANIQQLVGLRCEFIRLAAAADNRPKKPTAPGAPPENKKPKPGTLVINRIIGPAASTTPGVQGVSVPGMIPNQMPQVAQAPVAAPQFAIPGAFAAPQAAPVAAPTQSPVELAVLQLLIGELSKPENANGIPFSKLPGIVASAPLAVDKGQAIQMACNQQWLGAQGGNGIKFEGGVVKF